LARGIRQAVIVGSGLDSRAYRLQWPTGVVVYEIDQPAVISLKSATMAGLNAQPATELHSVGTDLREDWAKALQESGFDPTAATAWILEGLMIGYLPSAAQLRMLHQITALSAPGSQLIADHVPRGAASLEALLLDLTANWRRRCLELGIDVDVDSGIDFAGP